MTTEKLPIEVMAAIPDEYVEHGNVELLKKEIGWKSITLSWKKIINNWNENEGTTGWICC